MSSLNLVVGQFYITIFEFVKSLLGHKTRHPSTPEFIQRHMNPEKATPAKSEALRNFVAASTAVCFSQAVSNPIDVVSQKIMVGKENTSSAPKGNVDPQKGSTSSSTSASASSGRHDNAAKTQGSSHSQGKRTFSTQTGAAQYSNITIKQVLKEVMKKDGVRGLYRGYIPAVVQSAPSVSKRQP